ncbi:MAG: aromatic-ring-hydroxylating dioxygenase subunit beta [Proteobacteria bacterium]|nr:aromatic-ring-hydroxylating dioxygenase subunit beta [Pseudomonadota bacterium]MDA1326874.1 aromatic-ring-hydroxylating dioxygenase subunit beta [Pseudomonadota bacterium]
MSRTNLSPDDARTLRFDIEEFNTEYARRLDELDVDSWCECFTEDGFYRITARENYDDGFPVGLVWCEGKPMLKDRAAAVKTTMVYAPRYLRHYTSNVRVVGVDADGTIRSESNYLVVETLMEDKTRIFQAGRYIDQFVRDGDALLLKSRDCIYDSLLIPNDVVYPV